MENPELREKARELFAGGQSVNSVSAAFTISEQMDAIQYILQSRMDAALGPAEGEESTQ